MSSLPISEKTLVLNGSTAFRTDKFDYITEISSASGTISNVFLFKQKFKIPEEQLQWMKWMSQR